MENDQVECEGHTKGPTIKFIYTVLGEQFCSFVALAVTVDQKEKKYNLSALPPVTLKREDCLSYSYVQGYPIVSLDRDGQNDQPTDRASHRGTLAHLKRLQ